MTLMLNQYGVTLKRVEKQDIELIRKWRNHSSIRKLMGYQKIITKKQQIKWFANINNQLNYYFLIIINHVSIGVINCKDVNLQDNYGEGGIFIWDVHYLKSPYPTIASVILLDTIFFKLKIGNKSFIRILSTNKQAIKYNKFFGYTLVPGQEKVKNQWYILTKDDYEQKAQQLHHALKIYTNTNGNFNIQGSVSNINLPQINLLLTK